MEYIKLVAGVPEAHSINQLRKANPRVSFPNNPRAIDLVKYNVYELHPSIRPEETFDTVVELAQPALVDGVWTQQWNVRNTTPEEKEAKERALIRQFMIQAQERLDNFARTKTYDNMLSATTYATSVVPKFATEGQYCVNARDTMWVTLNTIMEDVLQGNRPIPATFEELEAELPELAWPE